MFPNCPGLLFIRLTKLATLLVRTLAKPLSKRVQHNFSRNKYTKRLLIGIGQTSHAITSRMQIWSAGHRVRSIKPLEEEKALKDGAEFVGESFLFLVSGGVVVFEYNRSAESSRKEAERKRQEARAERKALQAKLVALDARLKAVEATVKQNSQSILGLGGPKYVEPAKEKLVEIVEYDDDDDSVTNNNNSNKEEGEAATTSTSNQDGSPSENPSTEVPSEITSPATSQQENTQKPWWQIW